MSLLTTPGLAESIRNGWPLAALAWIDHPDGDVYAWSGAGTLEHDGQQWQGVGTFGRIKGIGGSKQLGIRVVTFELSGLPASAGQWLTETIRNRAAKAWLAGMNRAGSRINGDPELIVSGVCDYDELSVSADGAASILLHVTTPVYSIERAQNLVWSPEWLNETYRGEGERLTGLDALSDLADAQKNWTQS